MPAKSDDKVVKDIIKRYGATLDLKKSPYLIVEIIRQYGGRLGGPAAADCLPPGGPPPRKFDPEQLLQELTTRLSDVTRLSGLLARTLQDKPAPRAAAKAAKPAKPAKPAKAAKAKDGAKGKAAPKAAKPKAPKPTKKTAK